MSFSHQCTTDKCSRLSRGLCHCCDKHLKEHTDRLNEQLTPISDEFNQLADQLNKISLEETYFIKELDKWCLQAHQHIEQFYRQKRKEFESFLQHEKQKQENELNRIRNQFKQILNQQEATKEYIQLLNNSLRSIEQQIRNIQNPDFVLTPLIIDQNLCVIISKEPSDKNLLPLSLPYETLLRKENGSFYIATNQEHILICQSSKLCLLNEEMKIDKEIEWLYGIISDIFYSIILYRFVIITPQQIFHLDDQTMILTKYFLPDNNIKGKWFSGTSYKEYLFLSTNSSGSSIYQYKMFPSIELFKEWESPFSCSKGEYIYDLRSNNSFLGIIISNKRKDQTRLELRLPTTFEQQWTIYISSSSSQYRSRCSPLIHNQWLVNDAINSCLLHIDENGTLIRQEKYNPSPRHIVQLNKYTIIISTTKTFNLHQLS